MARVPSVAQTEQTDRPLATTVRKLVFSGPVCGTCGSTEIRPSNRRNALDILLACLFLAPYRCRTCRGRFYRVWRPSLQRLPDPPIAPLLVMPARGSVLRADAIESSRIDPEPVQPQRKPELISPAPSEIPAAEPESRPRLAAASGSIAILESDLSIRKLLRRLLERRGYRVGEIARAEDLPGQLSEGGASLLIVDVSAGEETNVETIVALARAHPSLKILALSAESLQGSEIPGRFLALPKPFPLDSFVDSVERLLGPSSPSNTAP
jgi:CheY-like chemotaxis protein